LVLLITNELLAFGVCAGRLTAEALKYNVHQEPFPRAIVNLTDDILTTQLLLNSYAIFSFPHGTFVELLGLEIPFCQKILFKDYIASSYAFVYINLLDQISSQFLRLTFMAEGSAASINASSSVSSLKLPTPIFCLTNAAISPDFVAVDLYTLGAAFGLGAAGFLATILPRHHLVNSMQIRESSLSYLPLLL
jgi:hypothetical protein